MTALLLETFLVWFTVAREFNWRATAPDMHWTFSDTKLCVHTARPYIYITIWCTTMHDNKTHIPYDSILPTK